jgi:hypothetical protein
VVRAKLPPLAFSFHPSFSVYFLAPRTCTKAGANN